MIRRNSFAILIGVCFMPLLLQGQLTDEYTIKAIWLSKLTHFVNWPNSVDNLEYFTIATCNKDPFFGKLDSIYQERTIWNKPVKVIHFKEAPDLQNIQILFLSQQKNEITKEIIRKAGNKNILLISDSKGYCQMGTHINFFNDDNRVKFELNESKMRTSGFFVSYRLLKIAYIIEPLTTNKK